VAEFRTMIVEESTVMRKVVERALRQAGMDPMVVFQAESGFEALELLKTRKVDLILSDINLPLMDGLEFLCRIRDMQLAQGVPVVMFGIDSNEECIRAVEQSGAQACIRTPFTAEQVRERVLPLLVVA